MDDAIRILGIAGSLRRLTIVLPYVLPTGCALECEDRGL